MEKLTISISDEMYAYLTEEAEKRGGNIRDILRELLERGRENAAGSPVDTSLHDEVKKLANSVESLVAFLKEQNPKMHPKFVKATMILTRAVMEATVNPGGVFQEAYRPIIDRCTKLANGEIVPSPKG